MKRYILIIIVSLVYSLLCHAVSSSEVVILKSKAGPSSYESVSAGFKSMVNEVNIVEYDMEGDAAKGSKIIKGIIKRSRETMPPDAILTIGMMASKLAKEEITDIPIIFCMVINPVKASLSSHKNIGGVSFDLSPESQLSRLRQIMPEAKIIGVMYNPENSGNIIEEAKKLEKSLDIKIIDKKTFSEKDVPDALTKLIKEGIQLLWLIPDSTVLTRESFRFINLKTLENRLPVMACSPQLVEMGAPFGFYTDEFLMGQQAGAICNGIINGSIKGPMPVATPEDIFMAINLTTMKRCGLEVSQAILDEAKKVFK